MLTDSFGYHRRLLRKDPSMLDELKNRVRSIEQLVLELRGHL